MPDEMNESRADVYPNDDLSDRDKAFMVINYPRPTVDPTAPQWTLNHALDVMNVPAYNKHAMLLARPDDVRKQFAVWAVERILAPLSSDYNSTIPSRGVDDTSVAPAWYRRVCADLAQHEDAMVDESENPRKIARATITRTDNLWPNESVRPSLTPMSCLSVSSRLSNLRSQSRTRSCWLRIYMATTPDSRKATRSRKTRSASSSRSGRSGRTSPSWRRTSLILVTFASHLIRRAEHGLMRACR